MFYPGVFLVLEGAPEGLEALVLVVQGRFLAIESVAGLVLDGLDSFLGEHGAAGNARLLQ